MLAKLLKHDIKSTGKVLFPTHLILIATTLMGVAFLSLKHIRRPETFLLLGCGVVGYTLIIGTLSSIVQIYLIVFFYRNMFSSQGYLTFTLPATPWQLLHSKGITGYLWLLLNTALTCLSILLLASVAIGFDNIRQLFAGEFIASSITVNGAASPTEAISLLDFLGISVQTLILYAVTLTLVSPFFNMAMGYASVAIGQLFAQHKVVGTVGTYLVITFILQFFVGIISAIAAVRSIMQMPQLEAASPSVSMQPAMSQLYPPILLSMLIFQLIAGIALYVAAGIIMNKKVNLD